MQSQPQILILLLFQINLCRGCPFNFPWLVLQDHGNDFVLLVSNMEQIHQQVIYDVQVL
jgi:hypothetical protein